ncbi:MAG: OmpH family outer membrane protein [Tannerella sp.]|jgi:outer membrane protein|nr:OmpH family outer membrane protein [Tannerella sp.]
MKNINYVINGVLAVAILILFILQFSGEKNGLLPVATTASSGEVTTGFPVAYFNVDSLLLNYNFSKDLNEQLVRKQENARANITQQARNLQSEVDNFQYKLRNGAFATQERAEQEQQRILKKQQDLQALEEKLTQELLDESQRMNAQLSDTIRLHLRQFNQDKNYQIIFGNVGGAPIYQAEAAYNITTELIDYLNKSWSGTPVE